MVRTIRFYALSDFGNICRETTAVAEAMNRYATEFNQPPDFVCGLGDNFYPHGVESVMDEQFRTIWRDHFLKYPSLRVPWRMVLGNHDYMWNPFAQIEYHYHKKLNKDGLWYMPDHCYQFSYNVETNEAAPSVAEGKEDGKSNAAPEVSVQFFVLDTNAVQSHVVRAFPQTPIAMKKYIETFQKNVRATEAQWKIVFGHHPMYTQGLGHSGPAKCLRDREYSITGRDKVYKGYALENIFVEGKVDAYFAGHEHVFQCHQAHGIHHFGCGGSGADIRPKTGLYDGPDPEFQIDWLARGDEYGFVCAEVSAEDLVVKFLNQHCEVIHEVRVHKDLPTTHGDERK